MEQYFDLYWTLFAFIVHSLTLDYRVCKQMVESVVALLLVVLMVRKPILLINSK